LAWSDTKKIGKKKKHYAGVCIGWIATRAVGGRGKYLEDRPLGGGKKTLGEEKWIEICNGKEEKGVRKIFNKRQVKCL